MSERNAGQKETPEVYRRRRRVAGAILATIAAATVFAGDKITDNRDNHPDTDPVVVTIGPGGTVEGSICGVARDMAEKNKIKPAGCVDEAARVAEEIKKRNGDKHIHPGEQISVDLVPIEGVLGKLSTAMAHGQGVTHLVTAEPVIPKEYITPMP